MAEYIVQIFPFKSIKSKYAGINWRWICPNCFTAIYDYVLPEEKTYCSFCDKIFDFVERKSFKEGETKTINLKEL